MSEEKKKTETMIEDLSDDLLDIPVATPIQPTGMAIMDYSDFVNGIEDITAESEEYVKALFYGPNGTGKTTIAGTFPKPILILDIREKGTKPLVGMAQKRFITTFEMFQMAYWYLQSGNHPYKTVVIDTTTNLQEIAMKFVMGKEQNWDATKDMDMPTKRDWGGLSQVLKRWLIEFRDLPMNVVFIAQEKRSSDDDIDADTVSVFPQLSASVRGILGGAVDVIGNTYIRETEVNGKVINKYCMRIGSNPKYLSKCRVPAGSYCPPSIVNPTFEGLNKIMRGEIKNG